MDSEVVGSADISALVVHWCSHAVAARPRWANPGWHPKKPVWSKIILSTAQFDRCLTQAFEDEESRPYRLPLVDGGSAEGQEEGKDERSMSMLDLATFRATKLCRDPFDFLVVPGFVKDEARAAINADFPRVDLPGSFPLSGLPYGPAFAALIDELRGEVVRESFESKFGIDLSGRPIMLTVRSRCSEKDGQIHTDSASKIITILIYMNPGWEGAGGRLRLLRSGTDLDDFVVEVPPEDGTLICFRRSDNSWHGHKPFNGPRRAIQMNWVNSQKVLRYETTRHRISALLKRMRIVRRAS